LLETPVLFSIVTKTCDNPKPSNRLCTVWKIKDDIQCALIKSIYKFLKNNNLSFRYADDALA